LRRETDHDACAEKGADEQSQRNEGGVPDVNVPLRVILRRAQQANRRDQRRQAGCDRLHLAQLEHEDQGRYDDEPAPNAEHAGENAGHQSYRHESHVGHLMPSLAEGSGRVLTGRAGTAEESPAAGAGDAFRDRPNGAPHERRPASQTRGRSGLRSHR